METATKNLEHDHEHILQLIDVMFVMAGKSAPDADNIETVISLIRNFADGFHHAKEENILFPAMIKKGFSKENGPIAVMLNDHDQGRNFVKGMVNGLQLFKGGDEKALKEVYENMTDYGNLLQSHISKENNVLFKMADKALSQKEQEQLLQEFSEIEKNSPYATNISKYIEEINSLKVFYTT